VNIFFLDIDPVIAARSLCDKHVVKMGLEAIQLLQTAQIPVPSNVMRWYPHKCARWVRKTEDNYQWLVKHGLAIFNEYTYRYKKEHASKSKLLSLQDRHLKDKELRPWGTGLTMPELAMPDRLHIHAFADGLSPLERAVKAYRSYYHEKQIAFAMRWTRRERPEWLQRHIYAL